MSGSGSRSARRWEYLTVRADAIDDLNTLGRQGWELIGVSEAKIPILYLKRPAIDFRTRVALDQKRRAYCAAGYDLPEEGR